MSWQRVATAIGEGDEQYPRRLHNRYLRERLCREAATAKGIRRSLVDEGVVQLEQLRDYCAGGGGIDRGGGIHQNRMNYGV